MKTVLWICGGLIGTAIVAAIVLRQLTGHTHLHEVEVATLITTISAFIAIIPLALVRKGSPVAVFQAGFGGTVIHLFISLGVGIAVQRFNLVDRKIFLFLLMGFYWISLIFLVTSMVRYFRRSVANAQLSGSAAMAKAPQN